MRVTMRYLIPVTALLFLTACQPEDVSTRSVQAHKAAQAAKSIQFLDNAEIDNIKNRIELTAQPGLLGFVLLMNEAGQPVLYEGVRGKITSGGKRLTPTTEVRCVPVINSDGSRGSCEYHAVPAPSDEGTYGSSNEYIFYWNQDGAYRQWNGKYVYSDKPLRLRVDPLVITIQAAAAK